MVRGVPCKFDLDDFVLLAASTRQFKGVQRSAFPSVTSILLSVSSLGLFFLEVSAIEESYNNIMIMHAHNHMKQVRNCSRKSLIVNRNAT